MWLASTATPDGVSSPVRTRAVGRPPVSGASAIMAGATRVATVPQ